jgi:hypothetical protein
MDQDQALGVLSRLVEQARPEEAEQLYVALSTLRAQAQVRMLRAGNRSIGGRKEAMDDRWLTANEAAALAGLTPRWFYERSRTLAFAVRPSPGRLRFSETGLRAYMAQHRGNGVGQ